MKKLIRFIISIYFLTPIIALAQTTPSVIGTLSWTLNPGLSSPSATVYPPTWQGQCGPTPPSQCIQQLPGLPPYCPPPTPSLYPTCSVTGSVTLLGLTATVTDTGGGYYSLSGQGAISVSVTSPSNTVFNTASAVSGSMFQNGDWYLMTIVFNTYPVPISCSLGAQTLSGECVGVSGSTSPITLIVQ